MSSELKNKTEDVAESPWTKRFARVGIVAQGVTFGIVAVLALKVAFGGGGKIEDRPGALEALAENPFGRGLIGALAVGLGGYALWRFIQAVLGRKLETGEEEGALKRVGLAARGALYSWLAFICASLVFSADKPVGGGGGKQKEDRATSMVLDLPLGRWLVAAVGLSILGAGAFNLYRALSGRFRKDLKEEQMGKQERGWYIVIGVIGHAARGFVFALVGFFFLRAAWQYDPKEAIGLDGALAKVAHADYGQFLLGIVAAGLLAYALFCLVQARYREV